MSMDIGNEINQSVSYNVRTFEIPVWNTVWHTVFNMNKLQHIHSAVFESIKLSSVSDNLQNQMKAYGAYEYSNRN